MSPENKKITELDLEKPSRDHNFVVATPDKNFRLLYNDVAEYSSIDTQSGIFLDRLMISGVNVSTGDMSLFNERFDDLSGYIDAVSGNVDIVSGNLHETGQILEEKIESLPDTFVFFNDIFNNEGPCVKTYYNTPTPNTFLSGITVNLAADLNVSMRWDGPFDGYIGTGYINGIPIPAQNLKEIGNHTRRFEGHIDNLNALGTTTITGHVNDSSIYGVSGEVTIEEVGADPFPESIILDDIINATPLAMMLVGTDALKQGDILNVFIDYDPTKVLDPRQEITGIQVADSGISNGTNWLPYNPTVLGNGIERTTLPIMISDRNGDHGIAVRASNRFGATGDYAVSNIHFIGFDDSRLLDQTYPKVIVSADGPTSYNGRTDGLRENETTELDNDIQNWSILVDSVNYSFVSYNGTNVTISNPNTFDSPKILTHNAGNFVDQINLSITATRFFNGSIASEDTKVKVANSPEITSISINAPAISSDAPHRVGTSDVKGGDIIQTIVSVDTQGTNPNDILIKVLNQGISNGTQTSWVKRWSGNPISIGGDMYDYVLDVLVTDLNSRNGIQRVHMQAQNEYGSIGDVFSSVDQIEVDNIGPTCSIDSVSYPAGQQAIKAGELAIISTTSAGHDQAEYSKPDSLTIDQLDILNPNLYESPKSCGYFGGGYNVTEDNFKIKVIKTSNGLTAEAKTTVNIADTAIALSIDNLPQKLLSSASGETYRFAMSSTQLFNNIPSLSLSTSQTVQSLLSTVSQGVGENSNTFDIFVDDTHTKGLFDFTISVFNLANKETNISSPSSYNIEGFTERKIQAHPNGLFGGLADIGTQVTSPINVTFENLSEAGPGPNGGTEYTLDDTITTKVKFNTDKDDKFFVCNSDGVPLINGSFVFNLDSLSRAANADVRHPAQFLVKEE
jgi:hypothetical protein